MCTEERETLAVDLDEVLCEFVEALCAFHNERYGPCTASESENVGGAASGNAEMLSVSSFHSYVFSEVWGGTNLEAQIKVHEFFGSPHFLNIRVVPGAMDGIGRLREKYRLVVVTSRQLVIEKETRAWLDQFFPAVFDQVVFGNHWGLTGQKLSKPELCKAVGATTIIDDNLTYAKQCASSGIRVLLFDLDGKYPWNKDGTTAQLDQLSNQEDRLPIQRVFSWDQVCDLLL
ncbi:hypothetical protein FVE85_5833 [Porphyridium purpureum]|uniref:Uncharacterized protein n=1 Tax=Porphyridium purpureum TaxID=35688 RepID=A0A5J4Z4V3_PORPP|nr:hypothetical protein FVE85_5833 [Porphyridium purpureum]|eukprot:POR5578..scf295_1